MQHFTQLKSLRLFDGVIGAEAIALIANCFSNLTTLSLESRSLFNYGLGRIPYLLNLRLSMRCPAHRIQHNSIMHDPADSNAVASGHTVRDVFAIVLQQLQSTEHG